MKAVGIRQLKNQLSRYLRMVREGETVLVTDRDEVVAEIHRPTTPVARSLTPWECYLNDQERAGNIRRAVRRESIALKEIESDEPFPFDWKSILEETRRDRF